jgi:hypothetical protein
MEDVLLAYLRSRREQAGNPVSSDSLKAVEPPSWTHPPADKDPFLKPGLPHPLCSLAVLIEGHKDYPESSRELGDFLKKSMGQHQPEEVFLQAMQARLPRVWMERFLFILLEVSPSDWQTAAYVLQFRHLKRLLLRVERRKQLNAAEAAMAREIIQALNLTCFADLEPCIAQASAAFQTAQSAKPTPSADLGLLIYLIRREVGAMGERKNWLEGELNSGEPEAVARLTPHLKLLEDRMRRAQEMAARLGTFEPLRDAPLGLEDAMGPFFFAQLREGLARSPTLAPLLEVIELQRHKRIPTSDLIALSTLCRWVQEARGAATGPLEWIRAALQAYDHGHFGVDAAGTLPALDSLLNEVRLEREESFVLGNFGENPYHSWMARDGLTRPFRSANPERLLPDIRATVLANIHRDTIILKLLDSPKVFETPGLVETIVEGSRSASVLSKIATRRELHAGAANARVPVALLKSPVSIPTALLRTLVNPVHVPAVELKALHRVRSGLRAEVAEEILRYLRHAKLI